MIFRPLRIDSGRTETRKGIYIANRNFSGNALSLEKKYVFLNARVNIGAAGAPTLQAFNRNTGTWGPAGSSGYNGIKSVTLSATGTYAFVLQDSYVSLLAAWIGFAQDAAPLAGNTQLAATGTNVRSATSPQITIQTRTQTAGNALVNPASGEVMIVDFELSDSTAV